MSDNDLIIGSGSDEFVVQCILSCGQAHTFSMKAKSLEAALAVLVEYKRDHGVYNDVIGDSAFFIDFGDVVHMGLFTKQGHEKRVREARYMQAMAQNGRVQ